MSISRKPQYEDQDLEDDPFRSIPKKFFDRNGTAWIVGFRVDSQKKVNPLFIEFKDNNRAIGLGVMVSTASTLIENLKKSGDYKKFDASCEVPEEMLLLMVAYLTRDSSAIKGSFDVFWHIFYN